MLEVPQLLLYLDAPEFSSLKSCSTSLLAHVNTFLEQWRDDLFQSHWIQNRKPIRDGFGIFPFQIGRKWFTIRFFPLSLKATTKNKSYVVHSYRLDSHSR